MYRKLAQLKFTTSPQAQQELTNIEMSKTSDALMVKYGFDLSHLIRLSKHYKLEENEEVKSFRKIVIAQKESEEKAEFDRAQPPKEVVEKILKEGQALGQPQYKQDGTMTFQYFLDTMKIVVRYVQLQCREGQATFALERRAAIKAKDEELYQKLIMKSANWEQLTANLIQANLYQALKVPKPVFEKSTQTYLMDPAKRTIYEDEIEKVKDELRDRKQRELTREEVLTSVRHLENSKFEAQKKMYEIVRSQKVAPQMINAIIKVEKMRSDDIFFNETGIEEEDVEPSVKRLNMTEDPEYKAIIEEFTKMSQDFLSSKKDETMALMAEAQKAQAARQAAQKNAVKMSSDTVKAAKAE